MKILKISRLFLSALALTALIAFTHAGAQAAKGMKFDSLKAVKEIAAQSNKYAAALSRSDSAGVASLYAQNAEILLDGSPSKSGHIAIVHFYGGMIRHDVTGFNFITTGVWGSDNNFVAEEGTLKFMLTNGKVVAKGRYLLFWKRENGELKIFRDTFFSDEK